MNWALEGLIRLQQRGMFDPDMPKAMTAVLQEVKAETNSVAAWVDDCSIELGTACSTLKDTVFEHYHTWCSTHAMRPVSSPQFWKRMHEQFRELALGRTRIDGVPRRVCNIQVCPVPSRQR
ncbi:hypothetical protein ACQ858_16060 [Variovorax ureilyticus]|uniref:hypothetical protein n=1 Tax=Variovorax ureilyticus TaxID=1836198 RepID=UPI003D671107